MARILILYYSGYGHTEVMVDAVAGGMRIFRAGMLHDHPETGGVIAGLEAALEILRRMR